MGDKEKQTIKAHNTVIIIITVSCIGAIVESLTQDWELWVVPLIVAGIVACWGMHVNHYQEPRFRENFYLIFSMTVAFYHGAHVTSYFDIIVIISLLMVTAAVLKRPGFLPFLLIEYFALMLALTVWAKASGHITFDPLTISRLILQALVVICIYRGNLELIKSFKHIEDRLREMEENEARNRAGMEDFLVNISHELRTPVNVINGMSTLILKKEIREDVISIREAGVMLSHQIEDIQDYSEIQRGDAILEEDRYMIISVINDIVVNYNFGGKKTDLEFIIDIDPNVPASLLGDGKKLRKIIVHLLNNAFKFTREGGVYLRIYSVKREYGVNLIIEVTDTGIGMTEKVKEKVSKGSYQANRKRNRSTGGIGLGLSIVFGFVRMMNGFVTIESIKGKGTTVRVSVVQEVVDQSPCLSIDTEKHICVAFHVSPEKFDTVEVREFYKVMASHLAAGLKLNLYSAPTLEELKKLIENEHITHVFMGPMEYYRDPEYFRGLKDRGVSVIIYSDPGFSVPKSSKITVLPKPIYGYPATKILNGSDGVLINNLGKEEKNIDFSGIRALIVDDEPMNLVVATGLFREYDMIIDTAESGKEAIYKYDVGDYDVVFMDHMMPEMDGIEAMKKLRYVAEQKGKKLKVIALTANAISGAREMFLREGFDGFISKPIVISDFEKVMTRVMTGGKHDFTGGVK